MNKDKALDLALEALEESVDLVREDYENAKKLYSNYPSRQARLLGLEDGLSKHEAAITAIKQARSAPVQEPVAWWNGEYGSPVFAFKRDTPGIGLGNPDATPLYTTPPAAPVQEPAIKQGWDVDTLLDKPAAPVQQKPLFADIIAKHPGLAEELKAMDEGFELGYKAGLAAAQRPVALPHKWVGLTDEEIEPYYAANKPLIKWVEAKLKEKNT